MIKRGVFFQRKIYTTAHECQRLGFQQSVNFQQRHLDAETVAQIAIMRLLHDAAQTLHRRIIDHGTIYYAVVVHGFRV